MDFKEIADRLLSISETVCQELLPGGKRRNREWVAGSIYGDEGSSFSVNLETGVWSEFAGGPKGGDLISLYAEQKSISQGEAANYLKERFSIDSVKLIEKKKEELTFVSPPNGVAFPEEATRNTFYVYRFIDGSVNFIVSRFKTSTGKGFCRWAYTKEKGWVRKGPSQNTLYGLDLLSQFPDSKPILLVEGEKTCEAVRKIVTSAYVVMTWASGTSSVSKTDWTPLHGRKILIWPDHDLKKYKKTDELLDKNDQPGMKAALEIAETLVDYCPEIKIIDPYGTIDVDGWDGADAVDAGWDWTEFRGFASANLFIYEKKIKPTIVEAIPEKIDQSINYNDNRQININSELDSGMDEKEAISNSCLFQKLGITCSQNGRPENTESNLVKLLSHLNADKSIWFDEFYKKIYTTKYKIKASGEGRQEWTNEHLTLLICLIQEKYGWKKIQRSQFSEAFLFYVMSNSINTIEDWIKDLKWDGVPRIDNFLFDYLGVTRNEKVFKYHVKVSQNFWKSLAARLSMPGCKVDNMMVLEGEQGCGKSSALEVIAGRDHYVCDSGLSKWGSADFVQTMQRRFIIEIAELQQFNSAEIESIKAFISKGVDSARFAYGKGIYDYKRTCIFAGTTNETEYLKDPSGARRFWPVHVGKIDLKGIEEFREQMYAEAYHRITVLKEDWHEVPQEALEEQKKRFESHPWEYKIEDWIAVNMRKEANIIELLTVCGVDTDKMNLSNKRIIGKCMRKLGWTDHVIKHGSSSRKVWRSPDNWEMPPKPNDGMSLQAQLRAVPNYAPYQQ